MSSKETKKIGDKLLELVELNRAKYKLLSLLKEYELNGKEKNKTYYDYLSVYEMAFKFYNEKLNSLDVSEKYELLTSLVDINPNFNYKRNIYQILIVDDLSIIHTKTFIDLGAIEYHLYVPRTLPQQIMSMINVERGEEKDDEIDTQKLDDFMLSDFLNMLYKCVNEEVSKTTDPVEKEKIINFKYNIIFLFDIVERRLVLTGFDMPSYPSLACDVEVKMANISMDDYLDKLDDILASSLEGLIKNIINYARKNEYHLEIQEKTYLRAFAELLADKELLDNLCVDITSRESECSREIAEIINEMFLDVINMEDNLPKYRRYKNI